jgi:hypothetical protein
MNETPTGITLEVMGKQTQCAHGEDPQSNLLPCQSTDEAAVDSRLEMLSRLKQWRRPHVASADFQR